MIPEGEAYILTCAARPASYIIRWEKDGAPVTLSDMVHVISGDSLVIREAVVSDSGKYTCVAQTLGGVRVAEATARVAVTAQQAVDEGRPNLSAHSNDDNLFSINNLKVACCLMK